MKPKRPTETDLLALVQNGFNAQLPKDRQAQAQVDAAQPAPPAMVMPMVRITLTIPEELRFRLKLAMMSQRRMTQSRLTQDEYCARAISAGLDRDQGGAKPGDETNPLRTFLVDCLGKGALAEAWIPKAKTLLEGKR